MILKLFLRYYRSKTACAVFLAMALLKALSFFTLGILSRCDNAIAGLFLTGSFGVAGFCISPIFAGAFGVDAAYLIYLGIVALLFSAAFLILLPSGGVRRTAILWFLVMCVLDAFNLQLSRAVLVNAGADSMWNTVIFLSDIVFIAYAILYYIALRLLNASADPAIESDRDGENGMSDEPTVMTESDDAELAAEMTVQTDFASSENNS